MIGPLPLVGDMDELQTIFYVALVVGVMLTFVFVFLGVGLSQWVSFVREGEHPVMAGVIGVTLFGILTFIVVTATIIVHAIIAQRGCLRC